MCHLSMKLSDKFDPNQMYTSDKIVVKHISMCSIFYISTKHSYSLTLSPRVKVIANNNKQGNKNIPPLNKQTKALLGNCSVTDVSNRL